MAEKHFYEQKEHTRNYLIPYFEKHIPDFKNKKVLEIGCAEGGFIEELLNIGIETIGLELLQSRIDIATGKNPDLKIYCADITDNKTLAKINSMFDVIVMRDTIEHISNRISAFENISGLLKPGGYFYVTFPARFSGFAGHQQNCKSFIKFVPYLHYMPSFILKPLGKILGEQPKQIDEILHNYKIGLSVRSFEKYYKRFNFFPVVKDLFFSRPIFKIRYKLQIIRFPNIPVLREFLGFGCEYLLRKEN